MRRIRTLIRELVAHGTGDRHLDDRLRTYVGPQVRQPGPWAPRRTAGSARRRGTSLAGMSVPDGLGRPSAVPLPPAAGRHRQS